MLETQVVNMEQTMLSQKKTGIETNSRLEHLEEQVIAMSNENTGRLNLNLPSSTSSSNLA